MKKNSITTTFAAQALLTLLLTMFTSIGAWAQITYTATSGTTGVKDAEDYDMLVDGDKSTKWCVTNLESPIFIEFKTSTAIVPKGYVLTTGNDTGSNPGRNPKSWVIKAKANSSDNWQTIQTVTDDTMMPSANTTDCTYYLENNNSYQFFRFEISAVQSNSIFQLAEFAFLTNSDALDLTNAIVSGLMNIYPYTGNAIILNYVVKDVVGNTLSKDTDYTATITKDGTAGEQVIHFAVGDGIAVTESTTAMTNTIYKVYENVNIDSRIQISGTVTLILGEGTTLNAKQGIEVANGNTLIIEGPGTLNATAIDTKSAIGAQFIGAITINGGTINATTTGSGAGIGGDRNSYCDENSVITINDGIVNAKAGSTASAIGGGWRYWAGDYGMPGTIIINGGQVTATGNQGIGKGASATGTGSSLILGWTNSETDFIYSANYNVDNISFAKSFVLDGTEEIATEGNINGKKIVPRINIANSIINGLQNFYTYTGSPIDISYTVTCEGCILTEGTDYIATITKDLEVTDVIEEGIYTLILTGLGNSK